MASIDSLKWRPQRVKEKGTDEIGGYILYTMDIQKHCGCHPETCCHEGGKIWLEEEWKEYSDGKRKYIKSVWNRGEL